MSAIIPYQQGMELKDSFVNTYTVYYLKNPINDEIFYVGITTKILKYRLNGHMAITKPNPSRKDLYIAEIVKAGQRPLIEEIEVLPAVCYAHKMYAFHREQYWISYYKGVNPNLTNGKQPTSTEYDIYKRVIESGQTEWRYYLCGKTPTGQNVYDIEHFTQDGFSLPKPPPAIELNSYNPFENQRFLEKLLKGGAPASFKDTWLDFTVYKDDDPEWYEQYNCTLFGYGI